MRNDLLQSLERELGVYRVSNMLKTSAIDSIVRGVKVRYGEELYLNNQEGQIINKWIEKYDKKFANRLKDNNGYLVDCYIPLKLDKDTYAFVQVGSTINNFDLMNSSKETESNCIKIYVFGKKYKKYIQELKDTLSLHDTSNLYIYDVKGIADKESDMGINSIGRVMSKRNIDTLFFRDGVKESICEHIENFFTNKELYESKDLTYKTGILLYGEPGTGKSSLSIALATKYKYNVIVIDMGSFDKLDISTLTSCINVDSDKYIILLEDIDTLFNSLNREDNKDKDDNKVINKMLQFLDSSSSPNDVIFIATTNHIENLDKAIIRAGRFDLKVKIGNIDGKVAKDMIRSFNIEDEVNVDDILAHCKSDDEGLYNPAELQNDIISYFKGKVVKKNEEN